MAKAIRVVHYLNQFFGGIGGEERADIGPSVVEGPIGPGRLLQQKLGDRGEIVATVICGDNYVSEMPGFTVEHKDEAMKVLEQALGEYEADVLIAGPAFDSCRYGLGCAESCRTAQSLGIPAATGMHPDNPAVLIHRHEVYIISTSDNPAHMMDAMTRLSEFALKLAAGQVKGTPDEEGFIPRDAS